MKTSFSKSNTTFEPAPNRWFKPIYAIYALPVVGVLIWTLFLTPVVERVTVVAAPGELKRLTLPEGCVMQLREGSVTYEEGSFAWRRIIELQGEACFDALEKKTVEVEIGTLVITGSSFCHVAHNETKTIESVKGITKVRVNGSVTDVQEGKKLEYSAL